MSQFMPVSGERSTVVFGLWKSKPRCPLDSENKAAVEHHLNKIAEVVGWEPLQSSKMVLPTHDDFDLPWQSTFTEAQKLLRNVATWMRRPPESFELRECDSLEDLGQADIVPAATDESAADAISPVYVTPQMLDDLEALVAYLATEVSIHTMQQNPAWKTVDPRDMWWVAELLPLWFGLGIFSANAVLRDSSWHDHHMEYWSIHRRSNLTAAHFGYALGVLTWIQQQSLPAWSRHLRRDAEVALQESCKYLEATADCLLQADSIRRGRSEQVANELPMVLQDHSASRRILGMWACRDAEKSSLREQSLPLLVENLTHAEPSVRVQAASTLDTYKQTLAPYRDDLLHALHDRSSAVRTSLALALSHLQQDAEFVLPDLIGLLKDSHLETANAAAYAVGQFGSVATEARPGLLRLLKLGVSHCSDVLVEQALFSLNQIFGDGLAIVREEYQARDPEISRLAEEAQARLTEKTKTQPSTQTTGDAPA